MYQFHNIGIGIRRNWKLWGSYFFLGNIFIIHISLEFLSFILFYFSSSFLFFVYLVLQWSEVVENCLQLVYDMRCLVLGWCGGEWDRMSCSSARYRLWCFSYLLIINAKGYIHISYMEYRVVLSLGWGIIDVGMEQVKAWNDWIGKGVVLLCFTCEYSAVQRM